MGWHVAYARPVGIQSVDNNPWAEEFQWRGVLPPKTEGVFGKWEWTATAILLGAAHQGSPWHISSGMSTGIVHAYPGRRIRSAPHPPAALPFSRIT